MVYRADITNPITPSTPSGRGEQLKAQGTANLAQAVAGGIESGISIFNDIKVGEFSTKQREEVNTLLKEKQQRDIGQKELELDIARTVFGSTPGQEHPALAQFKERQDAFAAAAAQFPQRVAQMKQRSGALLRDYIVKYPALADQFRKVSQSITGLSGLELDQVTSLYDEAANTQRAQAEAAKAQAEQDKQIRDLAFTTLQSGGMNPVDARMYANSAPIETLQEATRTVTEAQAKRKALDEQIAAGGLTALQYSNNAILTAQGELPKVLGGMFLKLNQLGLTRVGAMSAEAINRPEVRKILDEGYTSYLNHLDTTRQSVIGGLLAIQTADPKLVKQAREAIDQWYENEKQAASPDNVYLKAMAALGGKGGLELANERFTFINKFQSTLGIDNVLLDELARTEVGSEQWNRIASTRPYQARAIAFIRTLQNSALRGDSEEEFQKFVSSWNTIKDISRVEGMGAPQTEGERVASTLSFENALQILRRSKQGQEVALPELMSGLQVVVEQGARLGANASRVSEAMPLLLDGMNKLPTSEQAAVKAKLAQRVVERVYGPNGDADIAKEKVAGDVKLYGADWADLTGNTPLSFVSRRQVNPMRPLAPGEQPRVSVVKVADDIFTTVDNKLRIQAAVEGTDIRVLRKQFMENFNKDGVPSQNITSGVSAAVSARNPQQGGTLGSPESSMVVERGGMQVPPEVQAQRDREAVRLAQGERTPAQRLDYIMKLEKALQEGGMSPETRSFLSRELKLMRGEE